MCALTVAIGIFIHPLTTFGGVAKCIVLLLINTDHEFSEFFDKSSIKDKNIVPVLTENELEVVQRKVVRDLQF